MQSNDKQGGAVGRRHESLVARQARVGIVANPHRPVLHAPVPRDVWARWPDLRSATRRKQRERAEGDADGIAKDQRALDAFVRSVRGAAPARDLSGADDDVALSWMRQVLIGLGVAGLALVALFYLWRLVWGGA